MPGSGISENNIFNIIKATGAREVHASAKISVPQPKMSYENPNISNMGDVLEVSSEEKISLMLNKIKSL